MKTEKRLKEMCEEYFKDLEKIENEKDVREFLDGVLEIKRVQALVNGKWQTVDYIFVMCVGGPYIEINGYENEVMGYWGGDKVEVEIYGNAKVGLDRIYDFLDEVYGRDL